MTLETRVARWVITRLGLDRMRPAERAMRLLEESVELAQAEGITANMCRRQVGHVFARPAGDPIQEAGGVAVCILGYCASRKLAFETVATAEIERIESKTLDQIRGSLARKLDADIVITEVA